MFKTFLQENQFIVPSYTHYGGFSGYQDYGILGFQIKNKLINYWRDFFLGENIYEVEIPVVMPHAVLKASGHVDRFTDYVVYDANGLCYRADHLAKKWFVDNKMTEMESHVDSWDEKTLESNINKYKMIDVGSEIKVYKKNLMLEVPSNTMVLSADPDFLRPELAQGIFTNFSLYKSYLQNDETGFKPFGIAQIGKSYRKEISPQSFVRLREFTQAEIEYFVDPLNKTHNDFASYSNVVLPILTDEMQEKGQTESIKITVGEAIQQSLISHELMAYFLAKICIFAKEIGLKEDRIRFRQHQKNEMAHYASQCWDLECFVGGSWLECVGCADRGSYDLTAHSKINSKQPLNTKRKLKEPIVTKTYIIKLNMAAAGKQLGKAIGLIKTYLANMDSESSAKLAETISNSDKFDWVIGDNTYALSKDFFVLSEKTSTITHEVFTPNVIEPSFGIDRLMYAVLEQNLWQRTTDERRMVLSIPDRLNIYDVGVFPLHKKEAMCQFADKIRSELIKAGFRCYSDDSSTAIGKKYVRCDEIGVKYAITIDPGTLINNKVTIRNRETMDQIFVEADLTSLITMLKN